MQAFEKVWDDENLNEDIVHTLGGGGVVVMPTDTIYGIVARAGDAGAVGRVYRARQRSPRKPCIILIGDITDLDKFSITLSKKQKEKLAELWLSGSKPTSVILDCPNEGFSYLHRGTGSLAFRLPRQAVLPARAGLRALLQRTGPLIAPSANTEALPPSRNITEAKRYFGDKVDLYVDGGEIEGEVSMVVRLHPDATVTVIRQ